MSEKQSSPEILADRRWRSAVQKLEWDTIVQLSQLEKARPTFIQNILTAIEGAQFPNPQEHGKISSEAVAYINNNAALKELAGIVSSNEQSRRVEFWHCILYTGIASARSEKPSTGGVPNIVSSNRSDIRSVISAGDQLPNALQKKYADLIAQIRKENFQGVFGLKNISPEQAQVIVYAANTSPTGPLGVGLSIESMTPEVAKELIKTKNYGLTLSGLLTISPEVARILASTDKHLYLNGIKVMSPSLAAEFANHTGGLSLRGLKNINVAVATELAKHRGSLQLDGIETVTPEIVKVLASSGKSISMEGLQDVTPETVSALADAKNISLYHQTNASSPAYLLRCIRQGDFMRLTWEPTLPPQVAAELVDVYPEARLSLGVKRLSPATAEALAKFTGELYFEKLRSVDAPTAAALAKHHGELSFENIKIHDVAVASALARHTGKLWLRGYSDMPDDVLRVFAAMPEMYLQNHSHYAEELREREKVSGENGQQEMNTPTNDELLPSDQEELVLIDEEPTEVLSPFPENIDDYYVSYSLQKASGWTEGGSIKVGDLMRRVEQGTIPASYARDVLIRVNAMLYGEVDNLKMNEKELKAMQMLQKYIDRLQGK